MQESPFANNIIKYTELLDTINADCCNSRYHFMELSIFNDLLRTNLREANKTYVQELLFRCHLAAVTTLFRNGKWIEGTLLGVEHKNYFAFSASLRGLVESAADSLYCLVNVPRTILDNFSVFSAALKGDVDSKPICCEGLENALIHYSHAKKQPGRSTAPETHFAETSQEYLRALDISEGAPVRALYAELCEITHPAARTVTSFLTPDPNDANVHVINRTLDDALIADLVHRHSLAFASVFQLSFNSALLSLWVLNLFKDARFHTPGINRIDMGSIPTFQKLSKIAKQMVD